MKFLGIIVLAGAVLFGTASPSLARLIAIPGYQELLDKSDLVVVATPIAKTTDTSEQSFLPNIFRQDKSGAQTKIESIGVETVFKTDAILKGDATVKQFVLHHYREEKSPAMQINGPSLVSFEPSSANSYLLFLVREGDGRFAPTGGQTDPGIKAVDALPRE